MRPFHYKLLPSNRRVIISPEQLQPDRCNPAKAVLAGGFCNLLLAIIGDVMCWGLGGGLLPIWLGALGLAAVFDVERGNTGVSLTKLQAFAQR
jgi:hypothetical protein